MDTRHFHRLASAAHAAYAADPLKADNITADNLDHFKGNAFRGYVASTDETVTLAFRGTAVAGEDTVERFVSSVKQWLTNLDFKQQAMGPFRVHRGFASELDSIYKQLPEMLKDHGAASKQVFVTGHSAGAALATLAARRLHEQGIPIDSVYAYASPRVGDRAFAESYPVPLYRFEYKDDIVPHVPFSPSITTVLDIAAQAARVYQLLDALFPSQRNFRFSEVEYVHAGRLFFVDWEDTLLHERKTLEWLGDAIRVGLFSEQPDFPGIPMPNHVMNLGRFFITIENVCNYLDRSDNAFVRHHKLDGVISFVKKMVRV